MNKLLLYLAGIILFFVGIIFFCYQESWIIINIPHNNMISLQKNSVKETPVQLWTFKNNQWITETKQIIKGDLNSTLQNLINSWFSFLEEEQIINQIILANSVIISPNNSTAFISLNQNPFFKELNSYQILMIIEGMLKTIRENKITIQSIQLLVEHKPINDSRINFSIPWNIYGYTESR